MHAALYLRHLEHLKPIASTLHHGKRPLLDLVHNSKAAEHLGWRFQVPAATLQRMERDARKLARFINYQGAATVEWLYSTEEDAYYFLEVNPRLQVGSQQLLYKHMRA